MRKNKGLAIVIIDMQDHFIGSMSEIRRNNLIDRQLEILQECIDQDLPVVVLEYDGSGPTTSRLKAKLSQVPRLETIVKYLDDGFYGTNLDQVLKNLGVESILLTGVNASVCVRKTASSAVNIGYNVITGKHLITDVSCDGYVSFNLRDSLSWYEATSLFFPGPFSVSELNI